MASSGFPQRKSSGDRSVSGGQASQLDGPPPSPMTANMPGGQQTITPGQAPQMPSFAQMAQPLTAGTPGRATSPEVLMGLMESGQTIAGMFDSMASVVPDLSNDFALLKDLLQRTMAKLLVNGGQTGSAGNAGLQFPGGGFGQPY